MTVERTEIEKKHIKLEQDRINIIIAKFTVEELVKYTVVDVFDSRKTLNGIDGYQRPLIKKQVNNIFEYFKTADHSILPTSIILAIDKDDFESKDDKMVIKNSFRIIDGQHRIAAMKKYIKDFEDNDDKTDDENQVYKKFISWEYPVNIMLLNKDNIRDRYVEIRSFVDINKKGRKLTTDLADTNINNIQRKFKKLYQKDAIHHISTTIADRLMKDKESVWFESIKVGDNNTTNKLIGISSFKLSIMAIVRMYLFDTKGKQDEYSMDDILRIADFLYKEFKEFWKVVCDKWEEAFNWNTELKAYRIDTDFNIQKSLGVSSLHKIIKHYYKENKDYLNAMKISKDIIKNTAIDYESWEVGGEFSNYTSGSGHNRIMNIIIENANKE